MLTTSESIAIQSTTLNEEISQQIINILNSPDSFNSSPLSENNAPTSLESKVFEGKTEAQLQNWLYCLQKIAVNRKLSIFRATALKSQNTLTLEECAEIAKRFEGQNENCFTNIP
jgi:hypothetical protein